MKASKVLSTLTCLALLSTYSVSGFAKSGNGDSYSGPTLSGAAVSLTSDKQILNSQLTKVVRGCLVDGEKSHLAQILLPFYGKELVQVKGNIGTELYNNRTSDNEEEISKSEEYFSKGIARFSFISKYTLPESTVSHKSGWRTYKYKLSPVAYVFTHLNSEGTLSIYISVSINTDKSPSTTSEGFQTVENAKLEILKNYKKRELIVKDLPILSATTTRVDVFNQINGDYEKTDLMLKDLKMIYDRSSKDPYSQILNANTEGKVAPTQFMAPNAELADCVSDQLGRL